MRIGLGMKRVCMLCLVLLGFCSVAHSQQIALKSNFIYAASTTPNLALEYGLSKKSTVELGYGLNLFTYANNAKFKHWLLQPEYRWWFCESFNGHFVGAHLHVAQYNVCNINFPVGRAAIFNDGRHQGYLYGGGLTYGHHWILGPKWSIEGVIGAGYARIHYEKFPCATCSPIVDQGVYNYWGLTKLGLSLIYFIK